MNTNSTQIPTPTTTPTPKQYYNKIISYMFKLFILNIYNKISELKLNNLIKIYN